MKNIIIDREISFILIKLKCTWWCLGGYIALITIVSAIFSILFYDCKISEINVEAKKGLVDALHIELSKRNLEESIISQGRTIHILPIDSFPRKFAIFMEEGKKDYVVGYERYKRNITTNSELRLAHSLAMLDTPLIPDTLNLIWNNILNKTGIALETAICITQLGEYDNIIKAECKSSEILKFHSAYELTPCYVGYACEYKILGFILYSSYYTVISIVLFLELLLLGLMIGYKVRICIVEKRKKKAIRIPISSISKEETILAQISVISKIEKIKGKNNVYQLRDDMYYDFSERIILSYTGQFLIKGIISNLFLRAILQAPEYLLKDEDALNLLWPKNKDKGKLQTLVSRLRKDLCQIDPMIKIERGSDYYKLIL